MPLHIFACETCGTKVEKLTKSITTPVPMRISNPCPTCKTTRPFTKQATTAAIRTDSSHSSVTNAQRSSQRTSQEKATRMNNIKAGLTGDGRQPTNLKDKSAEAWGGALASANPMPLAQAKEEIAEVKQQQGK